MPATSSRLPRPTHRILAALLLLHIAAIVALAVSPRLHQWVHPDADHDDHDCAVVLFLHGNSHAAPPSTVHAPAPPVACELTFLVQAPSAWIPSVFSLNRIFEHAPPCVA